MKPAPPQPPAYAEQPPARCGVCQQWKWYRYRSGWKCQFCQQRLGTYVAELNRIRSLP